VCLYPSDNRSASADGLKLSAEALQILQPWTTRLANKFEPFLFPTHGVIYGVYGEPFRQCREMRDNTGTLLSTELKFIS
jgi:hypothetical protein